MSSKVNSTGGFTGTTKGAGGRNTKPTYLLEYDPANEDIKAESTIRIHVIFRNARVADIRIINNGKAK